MHGECRFKVEKIRLAQSIIAHFGAVQAFDVLYWPEMDGAKYWSSDQKHVFKFEGLGDLGRKIRQCSRIVHEAGFGARVDAAGDGMSRYEFVPGRAFDCSALSTLVLDRIAEYCVFRIGEFSSDAADGQFEEMVRFNLSQETGRDWPLGAESFRTDHCVIADGRMAPHEWIRCRDDRVIKVDASQHGDDHFFPGPTDIEWDLAGAIVDWEDHPDQGEQRGAEGHQALNHYILDGGSVVLNTVNRIGGAIAVMEGQGKALHMVEEFGAEIPNQFFSHVSLQPPRCQALQIHHNRNPENERNGHKLS